MNGGGGKQNYGINEKRRMRSGTRSSNVYSGYGGSLFGSDRVLGSPLGAWVPPKFVHSKRVISAAPPPGLGSPQKATTAAGEAQAEEEEEEMPRGSAECENTHEEGMPSGGDGMTASPGLENCSTHEEKPRPVQRLSQSPPHPPHVGSFTSQPYLGSQPREQSKPKAQQQQPQQQQQQQEHSESRPRTVQRPQSAKPRQLQTESQPPGREPDTQASPHLQTEPKEQREQEYQQEETQQEQQHNPEEYQQRRVQTAGEDAGSVSLDVTAASKKNVNAEKCDESYQEDSYSPPSAMTTAVGTLLTSGDVSHNDQYGPDGPASPNTTLSPPITAHSPWPAPATTSTSPIYGPTTEDLDEQHQYRLCRPDDAYGAATQSRPIGAKQLPSSSSLPSERTTRKGGGATLAGGATRNPHATCPHPHQRLVVITNGDDLDDHRGLSIHSGREKERMESEEERTKKGRKSEHNHQGRMIIEGSPTTPVSDSDEEQQTSLSSTQAKAKLRKAIVQYVKTDGAEVLIDDLIGMKGVTEAWKRVGRYPMWKILKHYPDFLQMQDEETTKWSVKKISSSPFADYDADNLDDIVAPSPKECDVEEGHNLNLKHGMVSDDKDIHEDEVGEDPADEPTCGAMGGHMGGIKGQEEENEERDAARRSYGDYEARGPGVEKEENEERRLEMCQPPHLSSEVNELKEEKKSVVPQDPIEERFEKNAMEGVGVQKREQELKSDKSGHGDLHEQKKPGAPCLLSSVSSKNQDKDNKQHQQQDVVTEKLGHVPKSDDDVDSGGIMTEDESERKKTKSCEGPCTPLPNVGIPKTAKRTPDPVSKPEGGNKRGSERKCR